VSAFNQIQFRQDVRVRLYGWALLIDDIAAIAIRYGCDAQNARAVASALMQRMRRADEAVYDRGLKRWFTT
jgi:hypothetical protein